MANAEGWIVAYECLEEGRLIPDELKRKVLGNRNGMGETMLHWYAIEGSLKVVEQIIDLGFNVNTTNRFGQTPLFESVQIDRWDIVELLLRRGADTSIKDKIEEDIFEHLEFAEEHAKAERLRELARCRS